MVKHSAFVTGHQSADEAGHGLAVEGPHADTAMVLNDDELRRGNEVQVREIPHDSLKVDALIEIA